MHSTLLGIDLGTSSAKAALFRESGKLVGLGRSPIANFTSSQPGWAESDPTQWWKAITIAIRAACEDSGTSPSDIGAVGLSVFYPVIISMSPSGDPLYPAILYNDQRSIAQVKRILEQADRVDYERRIGNRLVPGTCAVTSIRWLRDDRPEIYRKTHILGFANTYLAHRLTGEFITDPSNAALSGLAEIGEAWEWSDSLCRLLSVEANMLPRIMGSDHVVGVVNKQCADETGMKVGTPVVIGCGDAAASSFGAGALQFGTVIYIAGSSDCVTMPLTQPCDDNRWLNDAYIAKRSWLGIGTVTSSGTALDWFDREILDASGDHAAGLTSLAESAREDAGGVFFLPYLQGERTPLWDPHAKGMFFGITAATTRKELARAVLIGTAFALRDVIECLEEVHGLSVLELRAVGGSTRNKLWNQLKADVLQKCLDVLDFQETGSLGAAMLAGIGSGVYRSIEEASACVRSVSGIHRIEPTREKQTWYDSAFQTYQSLYLQTKDLMHADGP